MANHSLLIFGKDATEREKKAFDLASTFSSQFDRHFHDCRENSGIEALRKILSNFTVKPLDSDQTTIVLLEAQSLTTEAQNYLLKTLEEPLAFAQIILTAPTPFSVLATVASRCQKTDLGPIVTGLTEKEKDEFEKIIKSNLSIRLEFSENLDLGLWETFWRSKMLEKTGKVNLKNIVTYLRAIQKTKDFLGKRANPKLAKANLMFQLPSLD